MPSGTYSIDVPASLIENENSEFNIEQIIEFGDITIREYMPEASYQGIMIEVNRCNNALYYEEILLPYSQVISENPINGEVKSVLGLLVLNYHDKTGKVDIFDANSRFAWEVLSCTPATNELWDITKKTGESELSLSNSNECIVTYSQDNDEWVLYGEKQDRILRIDSITQEVTYFE